MGFLDYLYPVTVEYNGYIGKSKRPQKSVEPIHTYKKLELNYIESDDTVKFDSLMGKEEYGVVAVAECSYARNHAGKKGRKPTIDKSCSCGFYSYDTLDQALQHSKGTDAPKSVVAETIISGYYIAYDKGYRAEKQRIVSLTTTNCEQCSSNPTAVYHIMRTYKGRLFALCRECFTKRSWYLDAEDFITFEEIIEKLAYPADYNFPKVTLKSIYPEANNITRAELKKFNKPNTFGRRTTTQTTLGSRMRKAWLAFKSGQE
jgi:hypothetical protein